MKANPEPEPAEVAVYRIGEFSKICRVPVSALRYYSDLGLLPPDSIDPDTGYRYYAVSQLPRLGRILALKDLGLSLDQVGAILNDELSAAELRGMLRLKQAEISQLVTEEKARLARVEQRIRVIEGEGNMPDYEVVLKELESQRVLSIREVLANPQDVATMIGDGLAALMPAGIMPSAPFFSVYHDKEFTPTNIDVEIAFPIGQSVDSAPETPGGRAFVERVVPGGKTAVVTHEGPYDTIAESYTAIFSWISDNGLRIAGPPQEAYLVAPDDPGGPITEIRFPVV